MSDIMAFCPVCGQSVHITRRQHCRIEPIINEKTLPWIKNPSWYPLFKNGVYIGFRSNINSRLCIITTKGTQVFR